MFVGKICKKVFFLLIIITTISLLACSGGGGGGSNENPSANINPAVSGVTPIDSDTDIARKERINIKFNKNMNWDSVEANVILEKVEADQSYTTVSASVYDYDYDTHTAFFKPDSVNGLDANSEYRVTVKSSCADAEGKTIGSDYSWNFTTGTHEHYELSGEIKYEDIPVTTSGLDYNSQIYKPLRRMTIEFRDKFDNHLFYTYTQSDGSYYATYIESKDVKIVVWSYLEYMPNPDPNEKADIYLQDNTKNNAFYGVRTSLITLSSTPQTKNVNIPSGWDNSGNQTGERLSAPFAILDSVYTSMETFKGITGFDNFVGKSLNIFWSENNIAADGSKSDGNIGTSHYSPSENAIYILGKKNNDTDEFDDHVLVHEWGHYFEKHYSRSDSIGGSHSSGDYLDPRVAFGEGFANALSGLILNDRLYLDSGWYVDEYGVLHQGVGGINLETNPVDDIDNDYRVGWFNEESIGSIIYDLFDSNADTGDNVDLSFTDMYKVLSGNHKTSEAFTSIFTFIHELKALTSVDSDIDTIVGNQNIDIISDIYGTSETNNGNSPNHLPIYNGITIGGGSVDVKVLYEYDTYSNKLPGIRYLKFTGDGNNVQVTTQADFDVDLYVYKNGTLLNYAKTNSGNEEVNISTVNGDVYLIEVRAYGSISSYGNVSVSVN